MGNVTNGFDLIVFEFIAKMFGSVSNQDVFTFTIL